MTSEGNQILKLVHGEANQIRRYGVTKLGLFGSYARNEADPSSDLDFVVELKNKTFDSYMDVKLFLENLLKKKVDLVLMDSIKPRLKANIMKEVIYVEGL